MYWWPIGLLWRSVCFHWSMVVVDFLVVVMLSSFVVLVFHLWLLVHVNRWMSGVENMRRFLW